MLTDFKALLTIYGRLIGLIDEDLNFHHEQTAYIAYQVASGPMSSATSRASSASQT